MIGVVLCESARHFLMDAFFIWMPPMYNAIGFSIIRLDVVLAIVFGFSTFLCKVTRLATVVACPITSFLPPHGFSFVFGAFSLFLLCTLGGLICSNGQNHIFLELRKIFAQFKISGLWGGGSMPH